MLLSSTDISSPCDMVGSELLSKDLVHGLDSDHDQVLDLKGSTECDATEGDVSSVEKAFEDLKLVDPKHNRTSLRKCATFPLTADMLPSATYSNERDEEEEFEVALKRMFSEESGHSPFFRSMSLPTPLKLVSAMKGSRKKHGEPSTKLSVKWAPDVYDPPPSIVSHTVNRSKKQHKLKEERNGRQKKGKKGRKGSSSHGSSKEKKPFRKIGASTDRSYKFIDACDRVVELSDGLNDFDVAGPDSYCGSSFLKESLSKMHYSVAEAL